MSRGTRTPPIHCRGDFERTICKRNVDQVVSAPYGREEHVTCEQCLEELTRQRKTTKRRDWHPADAGRAA